jgi:16S rRNA (cytosine1402-N4)-methyltransferase
MKYPTTDYHLSVMDSEVLAGLAIKDHATYVDATLGGGSHTEMILKANATVRVFSFDQDADAIEHNQSLLERYSDRLMLFNENFVNFRSHLALQRVAKIDGILFDLGVSQHQIKTAERGLSFDLDGRLDMRMNRSDQLTAYDVVNEYSVEQLTAIFRNFGEERESYKIALGIVNYRQKSEVITTGQLAIIIEQSTSSPQKTKSKARIFQALRIYINKEMDVLTNVLKDAVDALAAGGRIVVISYHSLEDRQIKQAFNEEAKSCVCPHNFPKCICDKESRLKILSKKPITPSPEEISGNRQARSAKMRVAERI